VAEVGVDFGAVLRPRPAAKAADAKVNIMAAHNRTLRNLFIEFTSLKYCRVGHFSPIRGFLSAYKGYHIFNPKAIDL
jgi:hypothetical protein